MRGAPISGSDTDACRGMTGAYPTDTIAKRVPKTLMFYFQSIHRCLRLLASIGALTLVGCNQSPSTRPTPITAGSDLHPTVINEPDRLTSIETGTPDPRGVPTRVACRTCHSLRQSNPLPNSMDKLTTFHQHIAFNHGDSTCSSCHVEGQHDRIHLANGTVLPLTEALSLCKQCHGPQYRDYSHGSHGGMNGYWDRRRGPRTRNHCVDCHDPHAPQIPMVMPAPPPRDRFLKAQVEEDAHE